MSSCAPFRKDLFISFAKTLTKLMTLAIFVSVLNSGCLQDIRPRERRTHLPTDKPEAWARINKIVVIFLENTDFENAISQPFMSQLAQKGALLTNYSGITHPSQPNYIAFISGQTHGIKDDDNSNINASHLGDLLEAAGKTWKSYAEGYPGNCFLGERSGSYFRKHEPFLSFQNIQINPQRCAQIVNGEQFLSDLQSQNLPHFSLYIPDINNDGHDTGVGFADKWLSEFFGNVNQSILSDTTFVITFDEGGSRRNNRIATYFYGAGVKPGATSDQKYDHYSLLRTIESIFGLPSVGKYDASASMIDDIWVKP